MVKSSHQHTFVCHHLTARDIEEFDDVVEVFIEIVSTSKTSVVFSNALPTLVAGVVDSVEYMAYTVCILIIIVSR